jgi:hypothetical protein
MRWPKRLFDPILAGEWEGGVRNLEFNDQGLAVFEEHPANSGTPYGGTAIAT